MAAAMPLIAVLIGLVVFGTLLSHISGASLILPPTKILLLAAAGLIVQEGVARPDIEPATLPSPGVVTTPDPQS